MTPTTVEIGGVVGASAPCGRGAGGAEKLSTVSCGPDSGFAVLSGGADGGGGGSGAAMPPRPFNGSIEDLLRAAECDELNRDP